MIIKEKIGSIKDIDLNGRTIDYLELEWYETAKRILHKRTNAGKEIILKFLNQSQSLTEGDVVYQDEQILIIVDIKACESIVIKSATMHETAHICYEIGNKHLPLFYWNDELLVPYETPLFKMLEASGFNPSKEIRKLLNPFKTTVSPHGHSIESKSLFSKILQLTSSNGQ